MVLAIGIGNSTTCIGLFEGRKLINPQRIANNKLAGIKEWLPNKKLEAVIISSVIPEKDEVFTRVIYGFYKIAPIFINAKYLNGAYAGMGADRIANLIGGSKLFGLPICVVDFGSATTIDVLSAKGEYVGGIILPGVKLGLQSLHQHTALLPIISVPKVATAILCKSTKECIKAGAYWGEISRINGLLNGIKKNFNKKRCNLKFVITGGLGNIFSKPLNVLYEPWLSLYGLNFIWVKDKR
ncbi:MAG: type III pantothenate kinase [bacterium]|nr:type III pantothenate kinase [bacterium]